MPQLGADMTAGRLVEWYKKAGDTVQRGDIIAEVDTDKGAIEIEVFTSGVIERMLVQPGDKVPVGTPLAVIRESAESPAPTPSPPPAQVPPPGPSTVPPRPRVSPAARKAAAALGVDLEKGLVQGTGPEGTITRADVERAAAALGKETAPPAAGLAVTPPEGDRQARMRQAIAAAMTRSKREIPHFYLSTTIDLHSAVTWLAEQNAARPVTERLILGVLFLKAVALALREVPELNARWEGEGAVKSDHIHLGVATFLRDGGLVAPALHDADRQPLDELMRTFRDLVNRARSGALRSSELADPTITVTSLGERGVDAVFGVIYPPQVAIIGFGTVVERPWAVNQAVVARPQVTATLAADHRVTDGHRGGLFLATVAALLQQPERL